MTPQVWGLIIGGVLPALFYGVSGVSIKVTTRAGMSVGLYLVCLGCAVVVTGGVLLFFLGNEVTPNRTSYMAAIGGGFLWSIASACTVIAIQRFGSPLSQLTPLYNCSTLIVVALSLYLFAEWKQVSVVPLITGTVLILVGAVLVGRA